MVMILRDVPSVLGMARASRSAGAISVPPPPSWRSMSSTARWIFSAVAGTDTGDIRLDAPENRIRLKVSVSRRLVTRSLINPLAVSRGKPYIEPETSIRNIYSRGGISSGSYRLGGCIISIKKFSSSPWSNKSPQFTSCPVSL